MLRRPERGQTRAIAHPELNIIFDGARRLNQNVDQDSPLFTPHFLYMRNCYDSLCMSPRDAHLADPYIGRDMANGISREDWQFAIETMSRGWEHVRRARHDHLQAPARLLDDGREQGRQSLLRSLPEMAIDRIRDLARETSRRLSSRTARSRRRRAARPGGPGRDARRRRCLGRLLAATTLRVSTGTSGHRPLRGSAARSAIEGLQPSRRWS